MPRKQITHSEASVTAGAAGRPSGEPSAKSGKNPANAATGARESAAREAVRASRPSVGVGSKKAARARTAKPEERPSATELHADSFREAVSRLAYHFWQVRSSQGETADDDWLRAEQAIREVLEKASHRS
jgi:hypothetical protein